MRDRGFSLGLVLAASFLVGCSERQMTAPPIVPDLAASAEQIAAQMACERVSGAFVFTKFQFTSQTTAVGEGTLQGDLAGGFGAEYFDIEQRATAPSICARITRLPGARGRSGRPMTSFFCRIRIPPWGDPIRGWT